MQVVDKTNFYEANYNKELSKKVILGKEFQEFGYQTVIEKLATYSRSDCMDYDILI